MFYLHKLPLLVDINVLQHQVLHEDRFRVGFHAKVVMMMFRY